MDRIKVTIYLEKEAIQAIDTIQARSFVLTGHKTQRSHIVRDAIITYSQGLEVVHSHDMPQRNTTRSVK